MNEVKKQRVLREISQSRLASLAGLHQSQISMIESGQLNPTEKQAEAISKALASVPITE